MVMYSGFSFRYARNGGRRFLYSPLTRQKGETAVLMDICSVFAKVRSVFLTPTQHAP
ncbi:Transcriptional repressor2C BlaI/MecI family [gamma proteobacterium IMCC2047]|nr:Transcriptional repressor2C BlaI/MecI family [gamma proteobacterium IMCC2047]